MEQLQSLKTGALICAAAQLGCIAAGGSGEQLECLSCYAQALGRAFQVRDDMLDVIGTQEELGKAVGTDEHKNTFVRLFGLERCEEMVQHYTRMAVEALDAFEDHEFLKTLALQLTSRTT